jgi:hypothetical protein
MVMDVFSQLNTGITIPDAQGLAAPSCHPLSVCLKDRAFEYIVEHEKDRPPRNLTIAQNQCWQWFPDIQQSRICECVDVADVPDSVIRLIAIEKAAMRL